MYRARLIALPMFIALLVTGCSGPSGETPSACLRGIETYFSALEHVPGEARLPGGVPISGCLVENQSGGDIASVGATMLAVAARLNSHARSSPPGGPANLELGYLLGAASRGAEGTEGIHAELIRRLSAAAHYSPGNRPLPPAFLRAYREGYEAGHARG